MVVYVQFSSVGAISAQELKNTAMTQFYDTTENCGRISPNVPWRIRRRHANEMAVYAAN